MRTLALMLGLVLLAACGDTSELSPAEPREAAIPAPERTLAEERTLNEQAYREQYLPLAPSVAEGAAGMWVGIVDGHLSPLAAGRYGPAPTLVALDEAMRHEAPDARHRFIFQVGQDGDVDWPMAACELQHVVGVRFLGLLEGLLDGGDVQMRGLGPGQPITALFGDTFREITVPGPDTRMYVRPGVGPPGASGVASGDYCISTGFAGLAVLPAPAYPDAALWEIPGTADVVHGNASGLCRRALARLAWPGSKLDFVVPVAIWPDEVPE